MKPDFNNFPFEYLRQVIDMLDPAVDDYLFVYDYQKDFFYIAPHAVQRFALEGNALSDATRVMAKIVHPADLSMLHEDLADLVASDRGTQNISYRWMSTDGEAIWIESRAHAVRDESGALLYLVGCINEIGNSMQKADNLSGLLGLPSLRAHLSGYEETGYPAGYFLRVGLDDLKIINARLGVEYGDIILRKMGEFISGSLVPGQTAFRILGDEFVVIDFMGHDEEHAAALYSRMQQAINSYIVESNYEVVFTISAGLLSTAAVDIPSQARVLSVTEFALDRAKRLGKNLCYTYCEEDYQEFLKKRKIVLQLRQAVNRNFEGFQVHYQPLFDPFTGELSSAEALMRFRCEEYGMISPAEFIPLLEETTLIIPAGRWILHESLKMCKQIKQRIPGFHISVNLSYVQVLRSQIEDEVLEAIKQYGLSPSDVMVELTESGLLESNARFTEFWKKLRNAGVALALDDFGTGYSNFRYLAELGPDMVKIDRTFTAEAMRSNYEYELLFLFSKMVHQLNLKVCVEGVETAQEFAKICQLPPEYIQGYYLGRPCPIDQFIDQFIERA